MYKQPMKRHPLSTSDPQEIKGGSVQKGQEAPSFHLLNQNEELKSLEDYTGNGPLLMVFYPGDFTMVCTKQLCNYQDHFKDFQKLGVQIVGISKNNSDSHREFRNKYQFDFDLLSDPDHEVHKLYEVNSLFMFGGSSRAVFIISKNKKILYRYIEPTVITRRKAEDLLIVLEELKDHGII